MPNNVSEVHLEGDLPGLNEHGLVIRDASVDGQGGTIRHKPVFTIDEAAYYLNRGAGIITVDGVDYESGAYWEGATGVGERYYGGAVSMVDNDGHLDTLSFGFYETTADILPVYQYFGGSQPGTKRLTGFSTFDADQREAARQSIDSWDELISVDFIETPAATADINFMNTTTGPIQASAFLPYNYGSFYEGIQGDVAVNPNQASNHQFDEGQYGITTLIHELGHSLGLEHPGNYNFGPNFAATYDNGAEYYQDSRQYTIMSYWDGEETGADHVDWGLLNYNYASTPGVHDIAAIQRIYGAEMNTRTGNDTYGFNVNLSTNGLSDDAYDFEATPMPVIAIWDAGGNQDTLDLSGYDTPSIIDLRPGQFSSAGGFYSEEMPTLAEINARRAEAGLAPTSQARYNLYVDLFGDAYDDGLMTDNIGIAYGTVIENAVGGSGDDTIIANAANNKLTGGAGEDTFVFMENTSKDIVRDFGAGDRIDLSAFGIQAEDVKLAGRSLFADTDSVAGYDLHVVVQGKKVEMSDIVFGATLSDLSSDTNGTHQYA